MGVANGSQCFSLTQHSLSCALHAIRLFAHSLRLRTNGMLSLRLERIRVLGRLTNLACGNKRRQPSRVSQLHSVLRE